MKYLILLLTLGFIVIINDVDAQNDLEFIAKGSTKIENGIECGICDAFPFSSTALILTDTNEINDYGGALYLPTFDLNDYLFFDGDIFVGDSDTSGTEGFVIVFTATEIDEFEVVGAGGELGFSGLDKMTLGIEIDVSTQLEFGDTIDEDHISIVKNGDLKTPLVEPVSAVHPGNPGLNNLNGNDPFNIEDNCSHNISIDWDPKMKLLRVYFDNVLRLSYHGDLINEIFEGRNQIRLGVVGTTSRVPSQQRLCLRSGIENINIGISQLESCEDLLDLRKWVQINSSDYGFWMTNLRTNSDTINQIRESNPTFFASPVKVIDYLVCGTIEANASQEKGYFGIGWGIEKPFGQFNDDYNLTLMDWQSSGTTLNSCDSSMSSEPGIRVLEINGAIRGDRFCGSQPSLIDLEFPNSTNSIVVSKPVFWGDNIPWTNGEPYSFCLKYTTSEVELWIEDNLVYRDTGFFEPGRFGFYSYALKNTRYQIDSFDLLGSFSISDNEICNGDSIVCRYKWPNSLLPEYVKNFSWDFGDGTIIDKQNATSNELLQPSHKYLETGEYEIKLLINVADDCVFTKTEKILVKDRPTFDLGNDTLLCPGVVLELIGNGPNDSILWQDGTFFPIYIVDRPGLYVGEKVIDGCKVRDTVNVEYNPEIEVTFDVKNSCFGQDNGIIELSVSNEQDSLFVLMNDAPIFDDRLEGLLPGTYHFEITNSNGCQLIEAVEVLENDLPVYDTIITPISCFGANDGRIEISGSIPGTSFKMNSQTLNQMNSIFENLGPGTQMMEITDRFGCQYETVFQFIEPTELVVKVTPDTTIFEGEQVLLQAVLDNFQPQGFTLSWNQNNNELCKNCDQIIAQPLETTTYQFTAKDSVGCSASGRTTVNVNEDLMAFIPNAFSPNGDGINDVFFIQSGRKQQGIELIKSLQIFGRNGALVFSASNFQPDDPRHGWDGNFRGIKAQSGMYVVKVIVSYKNRVQVQIKNSVLLTR